MTLHATITDSLWSLVRRAVTVMLVAMFWITFSSVSPSAAQDLVPITAPDGVSETVIEAGRAQIQNRTELSEEKKKSALAFYDTAASALGTAQSHVEDAERFNSVLKSAASRIETLNAQLETQQNAPPVSMDPADDMNAQTLSDLQETLITKESSLRALRSRITALNQELETLQRRRQLAPAEQSEAQERIASLTEQVASQSDGELDIADKARRLSIRARLYMRRAQVAALEQEIISFGERQKIITASRNIAQIEQQRLSDEVASLQRLTGQQRLIDANRIVARAQQDAAALENPHPMVANYANGNIELAKRLTDIATRASQLPKITAQKRTQVDIVDADLLTATALIELGNLSRQSAATLRTLRNDTPSAAEISADIKAINQDIATATQARLLAQDELRDFQVGDVQLQIYQEDWMIRNPGAEPLPAAGQETLKSLRKQRRSLLSEIANAASDHYDALTSLKTVQQSLLQSTKALTSQLDQNLLWLPSTTAIGLDWPALVIRGAFETFSPIRVQTATQSLLAGARANPLLVLLFLVIIAGSYSIRKSIWADIMRRSKLVGRVKQDNYWHTPAVLIGCIFIALPLGLLFWLLSLLLSLSGNPDGFILSLANTFEYLAVFTVFFLTWRAWDRDQSLFDAHFKLPKTIRHAINKHLRWFIPFGGTVSALIALTDVSGSRPVYEGLSLAAFIVMCLGLAVFAYGVLWKDHEARDNVLPENSFLKKHRRTIAILSVAVPLLAAFFASCGYFETASELMSRIFFSGFLVVGTYVIHGVIRRSIMVGKRRLSLRQAIERRDKAVKMREEKAAAEERGEAPAPPPVDYEVIDVESMSRQSAQLVNVIIAIGFAALMWMLWSTLLPALTFFNGVELSTYMVEEIDPETGQMISVTRTISLWNVMQAVVIAGLTALAARNLPSFLEIFILSRVGIDAGTRYAIVTILGYIIIAFGVFFSLDRLGLQWSELKFVVAGLSVGIGLGLQKIIANFVSGLIILFERPIRLGDYVTIGDQSGSVSRIQIRATTLVDLDNREILIPNEALISERVTNWTLSNSVTRLTVPVGIAYGSDTDEAQSIMLAELKSMPVVLDTPAPQVLFTGFGDSALDFELRVFLRSFEDRVPTRHLVHTQINKALAKAGFSIPFPQRDLHIISQPEPTKTAKPKPNKT